MGAPELANPSVSIDQAQFEQALVNLLKNAKEACSQKPGCVTCSISIDGTLATISIEDDGQGIANPDNLFVPFYSTKPEGSGIGLVLSRQIAEGHAGTLELENREGGGARARMVLPLDPEE